MTDALVEKISAELYRQYKAHPEWDDAKDVVENFDHRALARAVLDHFSEPGISNDHVSSFMKLTLERMK